MTCRECPQEFKAYNTIERLCPTCRGKKLKEKKDEQRKPQKKNCATGRSAYRDDKQFTPKGRFCRSEEPPHTKAHLKQRGHRGEAKSDKYAIANRSKTQKNKDAIIAGLKAERIRKYGPYCEHCGDRPPLQYSHLIPKSIRPDLYLDPDNGVNACVTCHTSWESLGDIERVKRFLNLPVILAYLERVDTKRYMRVIEALKIKERNN